MDRTLAEHYNTQGNLEVLGGGYTGEDLQKQAAAEFLVKLAAEEGVDLGSLSDAEVGSLLSEIEGGMGQTKIASAEETEMQEKLAEADFLGRAMAHAYVNELAEIEKKAGRGVGSGGITQRGSTHWGEQAMERAREAADPTGPQIGKARLGYRRGKEALTAAARKVMEAAKAHPGKAALIGGGALALGGGAAALRSHMKSKEKKKAASNQEFENAAIERANQMLAEAGYAEKQAEDVGTQVEVRALQLLEEAGYPVNWNQ